MQSSSAVAERPREVEKPRGRLRNLGTTIIERKDVQETREIRRPTLRKAVFFLGAAGLVGGGVVAGVSVSEYLHRGTVDGLEDRLVAADAVEDRGINIDISTIRENENGQMIVDIFPVEGEECALPFEVQGDGTLDFTLSGSDGNEVTTYTIDGPVTQEEVGLKLQTIGVDC